VFSGHTQVNATDLRNMKYPILGTLKTYGQKFERSMTQAQIDDIVSAR
jgi:adenine-specific DNA-methyltransferase